MPDLHRQASRLQFFLEFAVKRQVIIGPVAEIGGKGRVKGKRILQWVLRLDDYFTGSDEVLGLKLNFSVHIATRDK